MRHKVQLFLRSQSFSSSPLSRRRGIYCLVECKTFKVLKKSNKVESSFMVCKLLDQYFVSRWSEALGKMKTSRSLTCWPRQILGPALKGLKINGLGVKYLWSLSSRKRSGSNTRAYQLKHLMVWYQAWNSYHRAPRGRFGVAYQWCYTCTWENMLTYVSTSGRQDVHGVGRDINWRLFCTFCRQNHSFVWSPWRWCSAHHQECVVISTHLISTGLYHNTRVSSTSMTRQ